MSLHRIYCINGICVSKTIGILSASLDLDLLSQRYPEVECFEVMNYCPVWVGSLVAAWNTWNHLRVYPLRLMPFQAVPAAFADTLIELDVKAFARIYNPMEQARFVWDIPRISADDVLAMARTGTSVSAYIKGTHPHHVARIAQLWKFPTYDAVTVIRHPKLRYVLDDGTHRFAAAIVRGAAMIMARCTRDLAKELVNEKLAQHTK